MLPRPRMPTVFWKSSCPVAKRFFSHFPDLVLLAAWTS